ncbi:hypothetical protein [Streptomyces sp. NPDC088348]|uniref:hypothetical protein n=1 Tax=Streptomyces sp. NPDC088348 TaxID=3365853 RepID=UPI0038142C51
MDFEIRSERGNYGRRPQAREREEYLRLVDLGKSNTEACRIVGINRRTGTRRTYCSTARKFFKSVDHPLGFVTELWTT